MTRRQKEYITLEGIIVKMTKNGSIITNPFANFDIFNVTNTGYQTTGTDLFTHFVYKYGPRLIGLPLPYIGKDIINSMYPTITISTISTDSDRYVYTWLWLNRQIVAFLSEYRDNYWRKIQALTKQYDPLENYNMLEMSGSVSKVSDTQSSPGEVTVEAGVFPYNSNTTGLANSKPESITQTSAKKSTAGFEKSDLTMRWASGDDFGETPQGNSVAMNKHTRSGNIGVTTSQQMLEQELKVRLDSVVDEFLARAADTCLLAMWK